MCTSYIETIDKTHFLGENVTFQLETQNNSAVNITWLRYKDDSWCVMHGSNTSTGITSVFCPEDMTNKYRFYNHNKKYMMWLQNARAADNGIVFKVSVYENGRHCETRPFKLPLKG